MADKILKDSLFINWADGEVSVSYSLHISNDLNNWSDSVTLALGLLTTDDADNLADDISTSQQGLYTESFADDLNSWSDSVALALGLIFSDDLDSWNDYTEHDYPSLVYGVYVVLKGIITD